MAATATHTRSELARIAVDAGIDCLDMGDDVHLYDGSKPRGERRRVYRPAGTRRNEWGEATVYAPAPRQ